MDAFNSGKTSMSNYSSSTSVNPEDDAFLAQLARYAAELEKQQYDWAKSQFDKTTALTDQVVNRYLENASKSTAMGDNDLNRYRSLFQPMENQLIADANSYASEGRIRSEMGSAEATAAMTMARQRENALKDLQSYGINPSDGRYAALDRAERAQQGAAMASAGNMARRAAEDTGRKLRSEAIGVGQRYPGQVIQAYQSALQNNAGAINASLANAKLGSDLMGSPLDWARTANQFRPATRTNANGNGSGVAGGGGMTPSGSGSGGSRPSSGGGGVSGYGTPANMSAGWMPDHTGYSPIGAGGGGFNGSFNGGQGIYSMKPTQSWDGTANWFDQVDPNDVIPPGGGYPNVSGWTDQVANEDWDLGNMPGAYTDDYGATNYDSGTTYDGGDSWGGWEGGTDYGGGDSWGGYDSGGDYYSDTGSSNDWYGGDAYAAGGPVRLRYAEGGAIPAAESPQFVSPEVSPSGGTETDDVKARLNAGEFVIPKDVAAWKGQEFFQKLIQKSRELKQQAPAKPTMKPAARPQGGIPMR